VPQCTQHCAPVPATVCLIRRGVPPSTIQIFSCAQDHATSHGSDGISQWTQGCARCHSETSRSASAALKTIVLLMLPTGCRSGLRVVPAAIRRPAAARMPRPALARVSVRQRRAWPTRWGERRVLSAEHRARRRCALRCAQRIGSGFLSMLVVGVTVSWDARLHTMRAQCSFRSLAMGTRARLASTAGANGWAGPSTAREGMGAAADRRAVVDAAMCPPRQPVGSVRIIHGSSALPSE
jgi:hypothetical protein